MMRRGIIQLFAAVLAGSPAVGAPLPPPRAHFVYVGDSEFAPYDYLADGGRPTGFSVEVLRGLAEIAGVDVEVRLGQWDKARADFDTGRADLISLSYSEERAKQYLWLGHTWTMHQCVLFPAGRRIYPTSPDQLAGEVIAVQERTAVGELLFDRPPPRPALVPAVSQAEALRLMERGIATGVGGNSLTLRIAAVQAGLSDLVEVPLQTVPYGFMARKGRETEFAWLQPAMVRLKESGALDALAERFLAVPPPAPRLAAYLPLALWVGGALVVVSIGAILWNYNLRRQVEYRTRELKAVLDHQAVLAASLATNEERYRTFLALSTEGIARLDLEEPLSVERPVPEQVEHIQRNARLAECNAAFAQMLRLSHPESLVGKRLGELALAADMAKAIEGFVSRGYRLTSTEAARQRPDGSLQWVSANALGIVTKSELRAIWLTQHEVTERKLSEEALRESEKKYRDIFQYAPVGVFQSLEDGSVLIANPAFARILGCETVEEAQRLNMKRDLWARPEDRDQVVGRFREGTARVTRLEALFKRADGTPFWVEITGQVFRNDQGDPLYFEGFIEDINARKEAEVALRSSEERYRLLFDGNPLPMLVWDLETLRFMAVNDAAVDQYGYSQEEFRGLTLGELGSPDNPELARTIETLDEQRPALVRVGLRKHRTKEGRILDIDVTSLALAFAGRSARLMVARDVTAELEGQRERERLQQSLRNSETMSALGSLVAGVAHEVRNPLFSISAMIDTLESELGADEQYMECTQLLRSQVNRLTHLMHDLLDYGKPFTLRTGPARPSDALHRAIRSCAHLAKVGGVTVVEEAPPDFPAVEIDVVRLEQAFENLVANAIQHSPRGGTVRATASPARNGGEWLEFSIEDEGQGVAPEDIPRLFEPFFSRRKGGTGLGLPMVRRIVDAHGGQVVVRARESGGAAFLVRLPLRGLARP